MAMYLLKNGDIICYMEKSDTFKLVGIASEREPNHVYVTGYFSDIGELSYCYISDYLNVKLQQIIKAQLEAYVKAHAGRYDLYKELNKNGVSRFYAKYISNMGQAVSEPIIFFDYDNLINGTVTCQINQQAFEYDFRTNEITAAEPLFYMSYKNELDMIVAKEQIKLGTAPQAFSELYRFQEALMDKQTVSVVFTDGETITAKKNSFTINDLFDFTIEDDHISYTFNNYQIGYQGYKGVEDVDYLKLGKVKYQFNGESLKHLCEPAAPKYIWRAA